MAWCRQATSHYLSQCWPWSLSPYDITRPQWVNKMVTTKNVHKSCMCISLCRLFFCWFLFTWLRQLTLYIQHFKNPGMSWKISWVLSSLVCDSSEAVPLREDAEILLTNYYYFFFKVGGPLKYRRCTWCPGSTCTFFSQWNVVIFVKPFLTNQKIISVIFLLVGLTNRDRVTTANCVCLLCFCGDVIGPEWAILIGCEIGSVRPFSCSDREWWSFLSRDETMGFVPKRGWAHHGRRAGC